MRRLTIALATLSAALGLAACQPDKADILAKAETIETKDQLRAELGDPDDIGKLGPIETWTYEASDGSVSFVIAGNTVTLSSTGEKAPAR
jgi:hypothetical protein